MARTFLIAVFSSAFCLSQLTMGGEPAAARPATVPQVQQTVERAIGYLQSQSGTWLKAGRCAACHHAAMPLWALSEAGGQGYTVDKKFVTDSIEAMSDAFATGQTLYVLALAGYTSKRPEIQNGINFLVASQKSDGSWPMASRATPDGRPGSAKLLTPITCAADSWATLALSRLVPKNP